MPDQDPGAEVKDPQLEIVKARLQELSSKVLLEVLEKLLAEGSQLQMVEGMLKDLNPELLDLATNKVGQHENPSEALKRLKKLHDLLAEASMKCTNAMTSSGEHEEILNRMHDTLSCTRAIVGQVLSVLEAELTKKTES